MCSSDLVVHYNLALVYNAQKNRAAALDHVEKALKYQPNSKDAQALQKQLTNHP